VPATISRRDALTSLFALADSGRADSCSVWVFKLLRPTKLNIYPQAGSRLHCVSAAGLTIVQGRQHFSVTADSAPVHVSGPHDSNVALVLEVPGVIRRAYLGKLAVERDGRRLDAVVTMDTEVAVGSIVGAELPSAATAFHALAAQAVAARSFILANSLGTSARRHREADFCDTTHCQFLRSPALVGSQVEKAAGSTRRLILTNGGEVVSARYSGACGGHTEGRWEEGYLYQRVNCEICLQLGLPRRGHGLGLCQEGAMGLARAGWHWRAILMKYYPGTSLEKSREA
jgi:peptidoglycan hydrolase-like amidase